MHPEIQPPYNLTMAHSMQWTVLQLDIGAAKKDGVKRGNVREEAFKERKETEQETGLVGGKNTRRQRENEKTKTQKVMETPTLSTSS